MKLRQIADSVAFYLQKSRSSFVTTEGQDMIISALNTARKSAELQHDFVNAQAMAWFSVSPSTGAALSSAKLLTGTTETATAVNVKAVDTAYVTNSIDSNSWWPIWTDPKKLLAMKTKERNYKHRGYPSAYGLHADDPLVRYNSDSRNYAPSRPFRGYFQGSNFYLDPIGDEAMTVHLDVQLFLDEYEANLVQISASSTASATVTLAATPPTNFVVGSTLLGRVVTNISSLTVTLNGNANETIATATFRGYYNAPSSVQSTYEDYSNWFINHGAEYLKWAAIVECNMFARQFVPRETGFLSPPEKARDQALERLIEWDNFQWEQGRQPLAIR